MMKLDQSTYRNKLFNNYSKRCNELDPDHEAKLSWFHDYASCGYEKYLADRKRSDTVLDIGCSRGYLLSVFQTWGFKNLTGIDLSPDDLVHAKALNPSILFEHRDAFEYLAQHENTFDIIITKAVLEHIEKKRTFEFIEKCKNALTKDGILIVDVPNMDWFFAFHERYMDFTHEVGFTIVSLKQVMGEFFENVETVPIDFTKFYGKDIFKCRELLHKFLRIISRKLIGSLFTWADPQGFGTANPIWQRSIIGVGYKS